MSQEQKESIRDAKQNLQHLDEWSELTQEEQASPLGAMEALSIQTTPDLAGLKEMLAQEYMISSKSNELKREIQSCGQTRKSERLAEEKAKIKKSGSTKLTRTVSVPCTVKSSDGLDEVITQLSTLKDELSLYSDIDVTIQVKGS